MGYQVISGLLVLLCAQTAVHSYNPLIPPKDDKCETLTYDICRQMDYNRTIFPNYLGHRKQSEAIKSVNSLRPLLSQGCSPDVLTFLCSVYFPMCTSINKLVPPCRELCLDVQKGCSGVLKKNGYLWPNALKCDQYPLIKTEVCIFQNKTGAKPTLPASFVLPRTTRKRKVQPSSRKPMQKYCPADRVQKKQWKSDSKRDCCKCCQRGNRAARGGISRCTLRKSYSRENSFLKTLKQCPARRSKRCYLDCCIAKKKSMRKLTTRRNRNRRNRNGNRRKRPVG